MGWENNKTGQKIMITTDREEDRTGDEWDKRQESHR
jgi:hypothetical protein